MFINRDKFTISSMARALKVSCQGYRNFVKNLNKPYRHELLLANMRQILAENIFNINYGRKRLFEKLVLDYDYTGSYSTVCRVCRVNGIRAKKKPRGLTEADKKAQPSDDLFKRNCYSARPNEKLITDITEMKFTDGELYLSAIFDCFDLSVLGLAIQENMETSLVKRSLINSAKNYDIRNAFCHSDRGSQYTSSDFRDLIKKLKLNQSMNSAAGRCHDNARCESMWARFKSEAVYKFKFKLMTKEEGKFWIYKYFNYWNNERICSAIGGMPPAEKRRRFYEENKKYSVDKKERKVA